VNLMVLDVAETILRRDDRGPVVPQERAPGVETIGHLGYESGKLKLVLNRSNAFRAST